MCLANGLIIPVLIPVGLLKWAWGGNVRVYCNMFGQGDWCWGDHGLQRNGQGRRGVVVSKGVGGMIAMSGSPRLQSFWLQSWHAGICWWPIAGPGLLGSTSLHPVGCQADVAYLAEAAGGLPRTWAPRSYGMGASPPPEMKELMGWWLVGVAS